MASSHNSLLAFPNPTNDLLFFNQAADFSVFDLSGKLIVACTNTYYLDASNWPQGVYILRTTQGICLRVMKN